MILLNREAQKKYAHATLRISLALATFSGFLFGTDSYTIYAMIKRGKHAQE